MEVGLYLHKISDTEYAIFGKRQMCSDVHKTVTVDGIEYSRTDREEYICDMEEEYNKGKLKKFKTDFLETFGYSEITLHYMEFQYSNSLERFYRYEMSSNPEIYFLQFLDGSKLLPNKISLSVGKETSWWSREKKPMFEYVIKAYGYNNYVTMEIGYHDIVRYNLPKNRIHSNKHGRFRDNWILDDYSHIKDKTKWLTKYLEHELILNN